MTRGVVVVLLLSDEEDSDSLMLPDEKKPSANLPFLETSLSPTASAWSAARVSFAAAKHGVGVCSSREAETRRSPSRRM